MEKFVIRLFFLLFFFNVIPSKAEENPPPNKPSYISPLIPTEIRLLRQKGNLSKARDLAINYLSTHPEDVDTQLILGLIYSQQKNYEEAEKQLGTVLNKVPTYMDARVGLIRVKIYTKEFKAASMLIKEGLRQNPKQQELLQLQTLMTNEEINIADDKLKTEQKVGEEKPTIDEAKLILSTIQNLRKQNRLKEAEEKAVSYLKTNPNDADVRLLLGLISFQLKKYPEAEKELNQVLKQVPSYTDARVGLVNLKIAQQNPKEAHKIIQEGLLIRPNDKILIQLKKNIANNKRRSYKPKYTPVSPAMQAFLLAKQWLEKKNFWQAKEILIKLLTLDPSNARYIIALAEANISLSHDMKALFLIKDALRHDSNNIDLWIKKGDILASFRLTAAAALSYKKALALDPTNTRAKGGLNELRAISPFQTNGVNEIGLSSYNAYVSDLHSIWDYSTLYYTRNTDYGSFGAKINYASRLGLDGEQYELALVPKINRNLYIELNTAYSDTPELFPNLMTSAEAFLTLPKFGELSVGGRYWKIESTYLAVYTGSLNFYPKNWWISLRPYYFVPKNTKFSAFLMTGKIRRYFSTVDHHLTLTVGTGRSPDLADLLTVNFLVIKNSFANLNYEFPIFNHLLLVNLGTGLQHWKFPSERIRNFYEGTIGIKYRF